VSFVDATDGSVLWRYNRVRATNVTGNVEADAEDVGYCDGFSVKPMANMTVSVTGGGSDATDAAGNFDVTHGGTSPVTVTARFLGSWFDIDRYTGTNASYSGTATPGTPLTIHWGSTNSRADERDCWLHGNRVHDWIKETDPAFTALDYVMPISVGRTDFYCPGNAWWDGTGMNFCDPSATYGNTGQMGDVIYHEYGHGITQEVYGFPEPPGDIHEGNSDVAANFNARFSLIGPGFYLNNCTTGIRNSENSLRYPDDWTGENHYSGQIIAGVHWDAWEDLLGLYPQAEADSIAARVWHFARKLYKPMNQPDQVYYLFVTDDDDANLDNGTPHYGSFCLGATNHGFSCPAILSVVQITHTPLSNTADTVGPYMVSATITSSESTIDPSSLFVYYDTGGGWVSTPMTAAGANVYEGEIPGQPCGTSVHYYITASDMASNSATHPAGAPASYHAFQVVGAEIVHDDFETASGWTAGAPGDDATTGMWERGNPQGTVYQNRQIQPEDDVTAAPGVNCYATQLAAGSSAGSYDVDTGKTTLTSPVYDLSGLASAVVEFQLWVYSGNTGQVPEPLTVSASDDGGATWTTIHTSTSYGGWNLVSVPLTAPVDLTDQVRFRFVIQDYAPAALVEAAVDEFRIYGCEAVDTEAPEVTVVAPNGGETWIQGEHHDITWSASDNFGVTAVDLFLSRDHGATFPDTLALGEENDGVFDWLVSEDVSDSCVVRAVAWDAAGHSSADESDALFEIAGTQTGVADAAPPASFALAATFPNPFGSAMAVTFDLPLPAEVRLAVYDVAGRQVRGLVSREMAAGRYTVTWDGRRDDGGSASSGVYFARLTAGAFEASQRVVLMR
jgi:hypothetical protein